LSAGINAEALLNSAAVEVNGAPAKAETGDEAVWEAVCEDKEKGRMKKSEAQPIARGRRIIRSLS
jgi:hypothetical protein